MSILTNYFNDIVESVDPFHDEQDTYAIEYDLFLQDMIFSKGEFEDTRTYEILENYLYETENEEFDELITKGRNIYKKIKYNKLGIL